MKKIVFVIFFALHTLSARAALHAVDGQETHGGNVVLADFWKRHHEITAELSRCSAGSSSSEANLWLNKDVGVEVKTAPRVFIGKNQDQEVVASNSPDANPPQLIISESRWITLNEVEKTKIVIHEALPILGLIDDSYEFSSYLYSTYSQCLTPSRSRRELTTLIAFCQAPLIEQWGPAEMSVLTPGTVAMAAYYHCFPALKKLMDYSFSLATCDDADTDSALNNAIEGMSERHNYYDDVINLFMQKPRAELVSTCDPQFTKTCATLKERIQEYPWLSFLYDLKLKLQCGF